jgi:hypothetical protein
MSVTFELANALERSIQNPESFEMPGAESIETLGPGQYAKLIFLISHLDDSGNSKVSGERMWVKVTYSDYPFFEGILANQPSCTDELKEGYKLKFEAQHIIDILEEDYA